MSKDNGFTNPAQHQTDAGTDFYPDAADAPGQPDALAPGVYNASSIVGGSGNGAGQFDQGTQTDQPPGPEPFGNAPAAEVDGQLPRHPETGRFISRG